MKTLVKIKRKSIFDWMIWALIMMPFLLGTINDLLGLTRAIRYILDFSWFVLLAMAFAHGLFRKSNIAQRLRVWIVLFIAYTLCVYIVQFQSPLYYLWGARNNFRFYAAFFAFVVFLSTSDIEHYLAWFDRLFWVNAVVSIFQYFVLEIEQDRLGGIFGVEVGCNGFTNLFFVITVTKSVVMYLQKNETIWVCATKLIVALFVAVLAELKFFFVEAIIIIIMAVLVTDFSWRKFWVVVGGISAIFFGASMLTILFPKFAGWFSIQWFYENALSSRGYTSTGDLNRLTAISGINDLWLKNTAQRIFGLGLGNCETSGFDFLNTEFFKIHGDMHYTWLSHAFIYLECGWIGLIFYFGFFALAYKGIRKIEQSCSGKERCYCHMAKIVAVLCVPISIYNASLRAEAGYMAYFVLAIPYVIKESKRRMTPKYSTVV